MLACYYSQGKQLASGVIGLLNCQSHYNVSGITRTPCARLLLRHPLAQRIPTEACQCSVIVLISFSCHLFASHQLSVSPPVFKFSLPFVPCLIVIKGLCERLPDEPVNWIITLLFKL